MKPDLTVELFDDVVNNLLGIFPNPPLVGQPFTMTVLVKNIGQIDSTEEFETQLLMDGKIDRKWDCPSQAEKEDNPPGSTISLAAGGSRIYSHAMTLYKEESHNFLWKVDAKGQISEVTENNNTLFLTAVWQQPPDLIVKDIVPNIRPIAGVPVSWIIEVRNIGKGDAKKPFTVSFMPHNAVGGHSENFVVYSLPANSSVFLETKQAFNTTGKVTVEAEVDVLNLVPEEALQGEANNILVKEYDMASVDLAVENLSVTPVNPSPVDKVTITFSVVNKGTCPAILPFSVQVFPGKVTATGLTQPVFLPVNQLGASQSKPISHSLNPRPGPMLVTVEVDAPDPYYVYIDSNRNNNIAVKKITCEGMWNGRLYTVNPNVAPSKLQDFITKDSKLESYRKNVALVAMNEANTAPILCGSKAKSKYGASGKWCSEFAGWIYQQAGMKDIRYCSSHFIFCWNYVYLHEVTMTKELVKLFDRNGSRFMWQTKNQVTPLTAEVGDYVALTTKGKKKNHSAIIVAVAWDSKYIWTVEGNVSDCVNMRRRDYFADGATLNQDIDGIGKLHPDWF